MTTYNFTISPFNLDRLTFEIKASNISVVLDHISALGVSVDIVFRADLSTDEQTTLAAIVAAHTGAALDISTPQVVNISSMPPFASKILGTKKLYKRMIGIGSAVTTGSNDILWTSTIAWSKMIGLSIVGGEHGDSVDFMVLDTATGTFSGVPNYVLNQFGFNVQVRKDFYEHKAEFDADVYAGLQLKFVYRSISNKTVGFNFDMNEVK